MTIDRNPQRDPTDEFNQEKTMRILMCAALLAMTGLASAQSADTGKGGQYVTFPEFAAPNRDSFNWNAQPPVPPSSSGEETVAVEKGTLPTQIVNGDFNTRTGWYATQSGGAGFLIGLDIQNRLGQPVAYIASSCNLVGPGFPTGCSATGSIEQKIHVESGKRLAFQWGVTANTFQVPIEIGIFDARTNRLLFSKFDPDAIDQGNGIRYSEIDLGRFAGMDVLIGLYTGYPGIAGSGVGTWVDSVRVVNAPAPNYNGDAQQGNWYNPTRSGSGWDLRRAPDGTFYALWFTYDQAANPTWYITGQGAFANGVLSVPLYGCSRNGGEGACTIVGRTELSLRSASAGVMRFDFNAVGVTGSWDGTENFELLVANGGNYSGHFHSAQPYDSAWGITTLSYLDAQNNVQLMAPIYYYDGAGQATWSIAAQPFFNSGSMTVNRLTGGLCPTCAGTFPTIAQTAVGSMLLNFDTPDQSSLMGEISLFNPLWFRGPTRYYKLSN